MHLEQLREDYRLSHQALAELAGISPAAITRILTRKPNLITDRTHRAVLASDFDLDILSATQQISSVGTTRRLQALCVQGWSLAYIARRRGVSRQAVSQMLSREVVEVRVARQIRDLYRELSDRPGPSAQTRTMAEACGWTGSESWTEETIENPRALPDLPADEVVDEVLVERFLAGEQLSLNRLEREDAYLRATQLAMAAARISELFGVTTRTVSRWRADGYPSTDQEPRAA